MKRTLLSHKDRISATRHGIFCLLIAFIVSSDLRAQTPDEHASHHPGGAAPAAGVMLAAPGAAPAMSGTPAAGGGMMEQMGEMMKGMGTPPPKELYPMLMALPELTPEQRKEVEDQANGRMYAGSSLIGQALDALNAGTVSGDYAAMHKATLLLREGTAQLESGIAARQALAEGRAPRDVAPRDASTAKASRQPPVGMALRWWLDQLESPATRKALLERHSRAWNNAWGHT